MTIKPIASKRGLALVVVGLLAAGLAACASSTSSTSAANAGATLVMESSPESDVTQAFNPFVSSFAPQGMGATGLIYEPLIQFNLANPSQPYLWLATHYQWGPGGKSITFTIRQGVKWNNGTPMTTADVKFTYDYIKANQSVNLGALDISNVTSSGDTVTVIFPSPQYTNLENIAGVAILPESVWGKITNPAKFADPDPVGTGPYTLGSFTPKGFMLVKNPNYWQASTIAVPRVYFPAYGTNTAALSALFSGEIDWTGNYIPDLQEDFVNADPATHHYWEAAGSSNALWPNLNKWPTNQLAVRQAIDVAIDRTVIGAEGESGLESPLTNKAGLTLPTYSAWSTPAADQTVNAHSDARAADTILIDAGYTLDSHHFYALRGREVQLQLVDPASFTDYAQDDALIAQQLRAAHMNVTFKGEEQKVWSADVADGNFQLTLHWGTGGVTPYNLYDNWLDDKLLVSTGATGDYEGLRDPAIETDLDNLAASSPQAQATALVPIEEYVAHNLPVIPTTTAADWFEYNSQGYVGWPTQADPYDSGEPSGTNNGPGTGSDEVVLTHLKPAAS